MLNGKTYSLIVTFFIIILLVSLFSFGCDSGDSDDGDNINNIQDTADNVTLNAEDNVAEIIIEDASYTIDVSSNPNAKLVQDSISVLDATDVEQTNRPEDYEFPDGLLSFAIENLNPNGGDTVTVELTFPTDFSPAATYFKVSENGFDEFCIFRLNRPPIPLYSGRLFRSIPAA